MGEKEKVQFYTPWSTYRTFFGSTPPKCVAKFTKFHIIQIFKIYVTFFQAIQISDLYTPYSMSQETSRSA